MEEYIPNQVSVYIPVYNEERFLRQCLESVVDQVDYVIIGDNTSTDGTEAICREFAEKHPHITYFRNEKNVGGVENFIRCAKLVKTQYIFHIGGHDFVPPNYVDSLKKALQQNKDAVGAYANVHWYELDGCESRQECYDQPSNIHGNRSVKECFEQPSGHLRAADFFTDNPPYKLIYSIFCSKEVVPFLSQIKPIAGCDGVFLFQTLLHGKMIHSKDTYFGFRNFHPQDTQQEYMKRIVSNSETVHDGHFTNSPEIHLSMVENVLSLFANHHSHDISESRKWKRYWELTSKLKKHYCLSKINVKLEKKSISYHYQYFKLHLLRCLKALRDFLFSVSVTESKIRIKVCGPSFCIHRGKSTS